MHLVTPQLAIGSRDDAANPELLRQFGIDAMLSLEPVRLIRPVACQMTLQVKDRIALPDASIEQAVSFIHRQLQLGRRLMAHCQMGISRSPALVLAYLHQHQGLTLEQALLQIQQARPQAEPHPALLQSLRLYFQKKDPASLQPSPQTHLNQPPQALAS